MTPREVSSVLEILLQIQGAMQMADLLADSLKRRVGPQTAAIVGEVENRLKFAWMLGAAMLDRGGWRLVEQLESSDPMKFLEAEPKEPRTDLGSHKTVTRTLCT